MTQPVTIFTALTSTLYPVGCRSGDRLGWSDDGLMIVYADTGTAWREVRAAHVRPADVVGAVLRRLIAPASAEESQSFHERTRFLAARVAS
jgi:hypothetical protein